MVLVRPTPPRVAVPSTQNGQNVVGFLACGGLAGAADATRAAAHHPTTGTCVGSMGVGAAPALFGPGHFAPVLLAMAVPGFVLAALELTLQPIASGAASTRTATESTQAWAAHAGCGSSPSSPP